MRLSVFCVAVPARRLAGGEAGAQACERVILSCTANTQCYKNSEQHPCSPMERHSGAAIHPRAGHFHLRTIEILRSLGLE